VISFLAAVSQRPAQNYAVLYARARFDEHADLAKLVPRLRAPYLGAEAAASNPPASGYVIRYRVERIAGVGPWVDSPRS
jgi:hypothetical protein